MSVSRLLVNAILLVLTGLLTVGILELVLPVVTDVTDNIDYQHLAGVGLHLRPGQEGEYIREEFRGAFQVNAAGFNNTADYATAKRSGVVRVAVVGDSFVEALQVRPPQTLFAVLARTLTESGLAAEAYSFGISGYGTAQEYHLIEQYVVRYRPDALVLLFVANDVGDSVTCSGRSGWTQRYDVHPDGSITKEPFPVYRISPWKRILKHSRLFRYIFYQRRLLERIETWRASAGHAEAAPPPDAGVGACEAEGWVVVEEMLARIDALMAEHGIPWLLVRETGHEPDYRAGTRVQLEKVVERRKLPYFDPTAAFVADLATHGREFRIPGDGHWNAEGHRVAGTALAERVREMVTLRAGDDRR